MSDTMRTTLQVWESRISQLTERIYELREGLAVARYQSEQTLGDDALSGRVAKLTAALATQEQAITVAREAQKDMSDALSRPLARNKTFVLPKCAIECNSFDSSFRPKTILYGR